MIITKVCNVMSLCFLISLVACRKAGETGQVDPYMPVTEGGGGLPREGKRGENGLVHYFYQFYYANNNTY